MYFNEYTYCIDFIITKQAVPVNYYLFITGHPITITYLLRFFIFLSSLTGTSVSFSYHECELILIVGIRWVISAIYQQ